MHARQTPFLHLFNPPVQYIVPRWQRRYAWREDQIKQLVEDLLTIATAKEDRPHYGGTMIMVPEAGPPGVVKLHRVVDGQQRLTTVSILLACLAETLRDGATIGGWSRDGIRAYLLNPNWSDRRRKLRLQDGDEKEYRRIIDGETGDAGDGRVAKAWRVTKRIVDGCDVERLLEGLQRLRVIGINLDGGADDRQQIFESLNATGLALRENEKVKNWLLMGLDEDTQEELHEECWLPLEEAVDPNRGSAPIDHFLRDVVRWRTGRAVPQSDLYNHFRRWAIKEGRDRPDRRKKLCESLKRWADLYGMITGSAEPHGHKEVEKQLRHLRALGMDVHRPFTLLLLSEEDEGLSTGDELARTLRGVASWITRLWLADRPSTGLATAFSALAHSPGPATDEEWTSHWTRQMEGTAADWGVDVPNDDEVRDGIRHASKYGGSGTRVVKAVLCAMMEDAHKEAPKRANLTIEHIMPQALTKKWREDLGDRAEEIHEQHRHRLGNLTLTAINPELGNRSFAKKQKFYEDSSVILTRQLTEYEAWDERSLGQRADELSNRALKLWPWPAGSGEQEGRG